MRSKLLKVTLFGFLLLNANEASSASCSKKLKKAFTSSFLAHQQGGCYQANRCQMNVYYFVKKNNYSKDSRRYKVLLLTPTKEANIPHVQSLTRNAYGIPWQYHFILQFDGHIYDFDFGDIPTPISASKYFEAFYPDTSDLLITSFSFIEYIEFMENGLSLEDAIAETQSAAIPYSEFIQEAPL
ncbi:MAG: hypothetical protein R3A80_13485 [Bdellovibrionota bacterium]